MEITAAQAELRHAYLRGGPGAIVSGCVWLSAALVASARGVPTGFVVLFFGGMLIFPISKLIVGLFFKRGTVTPGNPGGLAVIETVFPMIGGLLAAWLLLPYRPDWVFAMAAIAVGAHYFGFRTAYGDWTNWVLGGALCVVGLGSIFLRFPEPPAVPFVIAAVEILFGAWLIRASFAQDRAEATT